MTTSTILLLDINYTPIKVLPVRKAFLLLLAQKAFGAAQECVTLHSVSNKYNVPVVLRLKRYVHAPRLHTSWSRRGVFGRDNYTCVYCGDRTSSPTLDHVVPRSRGGKNGWTNTVCACQQCNIRKANRTPDEAHMTLLWEPKTPRVDYLMIDGNIPKAWKMFLEL